MTVASFFGQMQKAKILEYFTINVRQWEIWQCLKNRMQTSKKALATTKEISKSG